jgi:hypothetical protein
MYKNVSYPKQRSLLVLHFFVLPGLLTRVFTRSGNSLPDFFSDAYPDSYLRLCPIPYPTHYQEPNPTHYPSRTRACYTELYLSRYLSRTRACYPELYPIHSRPCYPELYPSPTGTRTISGQPGLTQTLTRSGKILPDRVPSLTRGLLGRVTFNPITYTVLPNFLTQPGNFLLALPKALPMSTL